MPIELDKHEHDQMVDVRPGTNEAEALAFLYAHAEYGFQPSEISKYTSIPTNSVYKTLTRLLEKDVVGKTHDGYYHALDDHVVSQYAESLRNGETFNIGTKEEYPDDIEQTTTGMPAGDEEVADILSERTPIGPE